MKIKFGKNKREWYAQLNKGCGGISTLIRHRKGRSLWFVLGVFKIRNLIKAI